MSSRLHSLFAEALQKRMSDANAELKEAQGKYQAAMAIGLDRNASTDALQALTESGRVYAHALIESTRATMEWLNYVDNQEPALNSRSPRIMMPPLAAPPAGLDSRWLPSQSLTEIHRRIRAGTTKGSVTTSQASSVRRTVDD